MTPPLPESYRIIFMTRGQFTIVDREDYDDLSKYFWCASYNKKLKAYYATRSSLSEGKHTTVLMHRQILGLVPGDGMHGDHINRNTLDNRRCNLRPATPAQNMWNHTLPRTNTSGFKGAWFDKRYRLPWGSMIRANGSRIYLGRFATAEQAHQAYREASLRLHGEFSRMA